MFQMLLLVNFFLDQPSYLIINKSRCMYVCVYVCDTTPPKPLDRFQPNLGQLCISSRREILGGFRVDATSGSQDGGQNDVWKTFLTHVTAKSAHVSRPNMVFTCFSIRRKLLWGFRVDATSGSQDGGQNCVWKTFLTYVMAERTYLSYLSGRNWVNLTRR